MAAGLNQRLSDLELAQTLDDRDHRGGDGDQPEVLRHHDAGEDRQREEQQRQRDAWVTIQRAHAIANGVYVAAVNRVGRELPMGSSGSGGAAAASEGAGGIRFWGRSFVADPFGRVLARASDSEEELLVVECDLSAVERVRRDWPFLRDRRIDAYADLLRRVRD